MASLRLEIEDVSARRGERKNEGESPLTATVTLRPRRGEDTWSGAATFYFYVTDPEVAEFLLDTWHAYACGEVDEAPAFTMPLVSALRALPAEREEGGR